MEEALNNLVKDYISKELKYNPPPEKESSGSVSSSVPSHRHRQRGKGTSNPNASDQEYIEALQECLDNKGVLREMQTFLRQRLVLILQEKWPSLSSSSPSQMISPAVVKLMQDFLCCRRLLYTFSVMASEIGVAYSAKVKFGKLPCFEAERLLEEFDIAKDSRLSQKILKMYADRESTSLLECLVHALSWYCDDVPPPLFPTPPKDPKESKDTRRNVVDNQEAQEKRRNEDNLRTDDPIAPSNKRFILSTKSNNMSMEHRLILMQRELEESKEQQIQREIKKFKETELAKIKEELQREMRYELIAKENELVQHYNRKYENMKEEFEKEKAAWFVRTAKECELSPERPNKKSLGTREVSETPMRKIATRTGSSHEVVESPTPQRSMIENEDPSRETRLRGSIYKLQEEKKQLAAERDYYASQSLVTREPVQKPSTKVTSSEVDYDTIAFLKYDLERQAEEINQLKRRMYLETKDTSSSQQSGTKGSGGKPGEKSVDSELLNFLAESKQRCVEIEEESKSIEKKILELKFKRSSRPSTPLLNPIVTKSSVAEGISTNDCSYSTMSKQLLSHLLPSNSQPPQQSSQHSVILKRPLIDWNQGSEVVVPVTNNASGLVLSDIPGNVSMHTVLDRRNEFMQNQSFYERKVSADLDALVSLRQQVVPSSFPQSAGHRMASDHETTGHQDVEETTSQVKPSASRGNVSSTPVVVTIAPSVNSTPPQRSQADINDNSPMIKTLREKIESEENSPESLSKVEKALRKGALMFEKITSEDEVSSASYKSPTSRPPVQTEKPSVPLPSTSSSAEKAVVDTKSLVESHEKYAILRRVDEENGGDFLDHSVSLSAPPTEESDSGGEDKADSDFWKM